MAAGRGKTADSADVPADRLIISLRSYVQRADGADTVTDAAWSKDLRDWPRITPQDWVLVFDCETTTTPDQRLRFGAYQLRYKGQLSERGIFYDPGTLNPEELRIVSAFVTGESPSPDGERIYLHTRAEFVEHVLFDRGWKIGAQIVGFNLPFDLSRLAEGHVNARRGMKGGFSFTLLEGKEWPRVAVKHLSQRAALIHFTGTDVRNKNANRDEDESDDEERRDPDRGYFVDVKTLAAALTSQSHSLESLSKLLRVKTIKESSDEHGQTLTPDYIRYGVNDVQTTWECFDALAQRFNGLGLNETGLYDLYSEASLGKAYLKAMGIRPWRELQPDFQPTLIGQVMSAYYGGRSEVHIRRQITQVIHTDFLSMYPTVCTLMGLWGFVRGLSVQVCDDTESVRDFVDKCTTETLRHTAAWRDLTCIVQLIPDQDMFPVRAHYAENEAATIGLNYLSADEPLWFTLSDVIVSKLSTGKTPRILRAMRFRADGVQECLQPITIAGRTIAPATDDFYKELIKHRRRVRAQEKSAAEADKARLKSDQLGIKILANATSYGIFVELNVQDYASPKEMIAYGVRDHASRFTSKKFEKPGRYFHPLLGTLITGAARLMLALAEHQVVDQGLDWAFCDTDSIAIANTGLPLEEFKARALAVRDWFADLNPYDEPGSILQLEKVNFPPNHDGDLTALDPPKCLAISAKRYVLFNIDTVGVPIIRKASGHGLGHLMAPYDEPPDMRRQRIERVGVPLWQEDLWREIIRAASSGDPDSVALDVLASFDVPAASQYAATTPTLLRWFKTYNSGVPEANKVRPFNFLLSLQAKSRIEMAAGEMEALTHSLWKGREPRPAAPYFKNLREAGKHAFDRERPNEKIPSSWLKSHGRSLVRYHLHPEGKFWGGEFDQRGALRRRHVFALAFGLIGKEADNIEEQEFIGNDDGPIEHPLSFPERTKLKAFLSAAQLECQFSDRNLLDRAGVSHHTLRALRADERVSDEVWFRLVSTAEAMRREHRTGAAQEAEWLEWARQTSSDVGGRNAFAAILDVSPTYLGKVLAGKKPISQTLTERFRRLRGQ